MKHYSIPLTIILIIWSVVFISGCHKNHQPHTPYTPIGYTIGRIQTIYTFSSLVIDPDWGDVAIRFDWGDGDTSDWSDFYPTGHRISLSYSWTSPDTFYVKAQAKDKKARTSEWSLPLVVKIVDTVPPPDKVWILGGWGPPPDVWHSSDGVNWVCATDSAQWPHRDCHTAVVFDNKMWVIGGTGTNGHSGYTKNDVWCSSDGVNWTCIIDSARWLPRSHHATVVFNNKIFLTGGLIWAGGVRADIWFTNDGRNWFCATDSAWPSRMGHQSVSLDNKIWVIAGCVHVGQQNEEFWGPNHDIWCSTNGTDWTCMTDSADFPKREYYASIIRY